VTRRRTGRANLAAIAALALAAGACGGGAPEAAKPAAGSDLPTVEVGARPDAAYSTASDTVERRREGERSFSGVLPDGFPRELPLPLPSSLVDAAPGKAGAIRLTLDSPWSPEALERDWTARLSAAGYRGGAGQWAKGTLRLTFRVVDRHPGARIELEVARQ
jgi:hypothetical protein